jgi:hypothetical protein
MNKDKDSFFSSKKIYMKRVFARINLLINNDICCFFKTNIYMAPKIHCFYFFCVVVLFEEDILNYCYYEKKPFNSFVICFVFYKCKRYVFIC